MPEEPAGAPRAIEVVEDGAPSFDDLYRSEYRPLLRLAWSLTGRRATAEEAVQEAMATVHARWATVRTYERPGTFARRVLLNHLTSLARRRDAERRALDQLPPPGAHHDATPPDEAFWSALRSLPDRQRQAVALHYLEDRSVADIAAVLDIAEATVKVHLHRGRSALAELLRDELAEGR